VAKCLRRPLAVARRINRASVPCPRMSLTNRAVKGPAKELSLRRPRVSRLIRQVLSHQMRPPFSGANHPMNRDRTGDAAALATAVGAADEIAAGDVKGAEAGVIAGRVAIYRNQNMLLHGRPIRGPTTLRLMNHPPRIMCR
jgi:hypothetical protein